MKPRYSFSSRHNRRTENIRKQKQKYPEISNKIIDMSDIVLEVLDSRFVEESRNLEVEKKIQKKGKKLVYILNKSDLVKKNKLKNFNYLIPKVHISCKDRKGIRRLRNFIKQLSKDIDTSKRELEQVFVGIIGYPNTGKSSLINLLIGKSSAGVGSDAGFTKGFQKIRLSEGVVLIDSPGVIPESEYSTSDKEKISKSTKLGGKSYSQIKEPDLVVSELMKDYAKEIEDFYGIKANGDSEFLFQELGKRKGFFKKKGLVDEDKTARLILKDWQEGKIKL